MSSVQIKNLRKKLGNDGVECFFCGLSLRWGLNEEPAIGNNIITMDHLLPVSRGGANLRSNLKPSCSSCNGAKGEMTLDEFRETAWFKLTCFGEARRYELECSPLWLDLYKINEEAIGRWIGRVVCSPYMRCVNTSGHHVYSRDASPDVKPEKIIDLKGKRKEEKSA